jgi:hypothetical protein
MVYSQPCLPLIGIRIRLRLTLLVRQAGRRPIMFLKQEDINAKMSQIVALSQSSSVTLVRNLYGRIERCISILGFHLI